MFRRPLLRTAAIATVVGITCFTTADASCTTCTNQSTQSTETTVAQPASPSAGESRPKFLVTVPAGSKVVIPAGTRMWASNPIVISDTRVSDLPLATGTWMATTEGQAETEERDQTLVSPTASPGFTQNVLHDIPALDTYTSEAPVDLPILELQDAVALPSLAKNGEDSLASEYDSEMTFAGVDDVDADFVAAIVALEEELTEAEELPTTVIDVMEDRTQDKVETVDLYADSEDSEFTKYLLEDFSDEDEELYRTLVVSGAELSDDQATLELSSEAATEAEAVAVLPRAELELRPDEALNDLDEEDETTDVALGLAATGDSNTAEESLVLVVKEDKPDFGWLPPFVLIPVLGLFCAEKIRRERSKKRFERAIEHGKRIQSLPVSVQPLPEEVIQAAFDEPIEVAASVSETELRNMDAISNEMECVELEIESMDREMSAGMDSDAVYEESPLDAFTAEEFTTEEVSSLELVTGTTENARSLPTLPPAQAEAMDIENVEAMPLQLPSMPESIPASLNVESVQELPTTNTSRAITELEAVEQSNENVDDSYGTENDPRIGTTTTDWTVIEVDDSVETSHFAVGSTIVPPMLIDADQPDEIDHWTGVLEQTNAARAEFIGFESREQDFRDRWDRAAAKAAVDAKKVESQSE